MRLIFLSLLMFFFLFEKPLSFAQDDQLAAVLGIEQTEKYLPLLKNKRIAVVGNHSSSIDGKHIVDLLLENQVEVLKVFSPEHGFRGKADAGEKVNDAIDQKTGLPIVSLYGDNKKPTNSQLQGVDLILFDIQDVGVRFYTYISTLHYVMEAAAENKIQLLVLDRPNPNGHYVDGPILEKRYSSFVGLHPVPIVHGMTVGEYAQMINGEKWLSEGIQCDLTVVACLNYKKSDVYELPIAPSPNLPNMRSIYLYPSLCLFEGTVVSVGRGTDKPFQQIGHPAFTYYPYTFLPEATEGAKNPKLEGKRCHGVDFTVRTAKSFRMMKRLDLSYLIDFYKSYPQKSRFFTDYFNLLAGTNQLQQAIVEGKTEMQIRSSWEEGIDNYQKMRTDYLIYEQ
ncbi:MAG: DUF1343 domain-containing protein [Vicingaceae bacterium]